MKIIVLDENGNPIDELAERNEKIKQALSGILAEFIEEKNTNKTLKVKEKLGFRFAKQIFLELSKYPRMSAEKFDALTYEEIEDYWLKYQELTAYYNRYFEVVDNRQLFLTFMGINSRQYSQLEDSDDDDIKELINAINTTFLGLGYFAGESGNADAKAVSTRLRASGSAGHGIISASEDKLIDKVAPKSADQLLKDVRAALGTISAVNPKLTGGKK